MVRIFLHQLAYENRIFWRNHVAAFFTVALPLVFLLAFWALLGDLRFDTAGDDSHAMYFYIPALSVFSVVGACFTNIAMTVSDVRDRGLFKRFRATPLPLSVFIAAKITFTALLGVLLVGLVSGIGAALTGIYPQSQLTGHLVVVLLVGSGAFCALGLAMTTVIPNSNAAPAIVQGVVLPLLFLSDIYFPLTFAPEWLQTVASIFPIRHMSQALQQVFNPEVTVASYQWIHLLVLGVWGLVGVVIALRYFRWEPKYQ